MTHRVLIGTLNGQFPRHNTELNLSVSQVSRGVLSKSVPAAFGVEGYFFRYERHFEYRKRVENGDIGIVTILHERMHQSDRFRDDLLG